MDANIKQRARDDYAKSKQVWPFNGPTFQHFKSPAELEQHKKEVAEAQRNGAPF